MRDIFGVSCNLMSQVTDSGQSRGQRYLTEKLRRPKIEVQHNKWRPKPKQSTKKLWNHYLGSIDETVRPFTENFSLQFVETFLFIVPRLVTKAGCLGVGRAARSLLSIGTIQDIVGRSIGFSCTQRSPMLMYRTLDVEEGYAIEGSFNSEALSLIHKSHAWIINS